MKIIPYTQQTLCDQDLKEVQSCFDQSWITRGPKVEAFETAIAQYCRAKYAVAFSSGTAALSAASYAGEISKTDRVISSPNTFVGTLSGALKYTQHLELVDIELETGTCNFSHLGSRDPTQRLCLFPVLFSGIAQKVFKPHSNTLLIEDACQAFGSRYMSGEPVGCCLHSDMTVFSFHPAKTLCMGEGGVVTTNDVHYYKRLLLFRNNGIVKSPEHDPWYYEVMDLTHNFNVTEFQAALGLSQLKKVGRYLEQRKRLAHHYRTRLKELELVSCLTEKYDAYSAHNLFPIQIDLTQTHWNRKELMLELKKLGILTQVHFIPLYRHPYFQRHFNFSIESFPKMERYYERALSLPLYAHLTTEEVDTICDSLVSLLSCSKV